MKKAFTMLELVFVIVIVGILAAVMIPRIDTNPLQEAALQLASHIRYTQHLAIMDDKYDANNSKWYKERWQLIFSEGAEANYQEAYSIFADTDGISNGNVNESEVAFNPENSNQLMSGGFAGAVDELDIRHNDFRGMKKLNLGMSYGVTDVTFSGGCSSAKRIAFDYLGRPIQGNLRTTTSAYNTTASPRLVVNDCNITLSNGTDSVSIIIRPETGYTSISF